MTHPLRESSLEHHTQDHGIYGVPLIQCHSGLPSHAYYSTGMANTPQSIYSYDAESDADFAVVEYLQNKSPRDPNRVFTAELQDKWTNWFLDSKSSTTSRL